MKIVKLVNTQKEIIKYGLDSIVVDHIESNFYSDLDIYTFISNLKKLYEAKFEILTIQDFNLLDSTEKLNYLKEVTFLKDSIVSLQKVFLKLNPKINTTLIDLIELQNSFKDSIKF